MNEQLLIQGLRELKLPEEIISSVSPKMEQYIKELILFNSAYNLTNTSDHDELVVRHILDSLSPYTTISETLKQLSNEKPENILIGDIGSGGGLPGIPLSAAFPQYKFNLVERMNKRCAFLENCAAILGLKNVQVVNSEAEKIPSCTYDFIVFRAFRPLDSKMIKTLLSMVKPGGYLAAYKAKKENIVTEMEAIKAFAPEYTIIPLSVPNLKENERNLVLIKK